jgi:UDP-N-acetylmuramate dehydrogenase
VVAAHWRLTEDDPVAIRARLDELRAWRRATQPLRERNCGSVFTNPPGDSAGRLIEAAGGKAMRCGAATVSAKHANFITVGPGARAAEVHALIAAVRRRVHEAGGPLLEPEVRLVGAFPDPPIGC